MVRSLCLIMTLTLVGAGGSVVADARVTIPQNDFAFGYVPQHARVTHSYVFRSTGSDTLRIDHVAPGCSCTRALVPKKIVAPGDSTVCDVIFDTWVYIGGVAKDAEVVTVPDQSERVALRYTATVVTRPDSTTPIVISPYKLNLMPSSAGGGTAHAFTLRNVTAQPLVPKLIDEPSDLMQITLPNVVPPNGSAQGTVTLTKAGSATDFERSFTIEFDDSQASRFTVPVRRGTVHEPVYGAPMKH